MTTREELIPIWKYFNKFNPSSGDYDVRFSHAAVLNKKALKDEIEAIQVALTAPIGEDWDNYDEKRKEICEVYCERNEEGNVVNVTDPMTGNSQYKIVEDKKQEFDSKLNELKEEHPKAIEAYEDKQNKLKEILTEEIEVKFYKVELNWLPKNTSMLEIELLMDKGILKDDK